MDYRRVRQPGGCYFFTLVTYQRRPFTIDAIVILPDHLHTLWTLPDNDADYSQRWTNIKQFFSTGCVGADVPVTASRKKKREKAVWQRRFWEHTVRDDDDWQRHMDYVHYNPVKHHHAELPRNWPHSSFHRCVAKGWYDENWGHCEPESIRGMDYE